MINKAKLALIVAVVAHCIESIPVGAISACGDGHSFPDQSNDGRRMIERAQACASEPSPQSDVDSNSPASMGISISS
jgi:hypothetical protein